LEQQGKTDILNDRERGKETGTLKNVGDLTGPQNFARSEARPREAPCRGAVQDLLVDGGA
jgi:hypothetical protein